MTHAAPPALWSPRIVDFPALFDPFLNESGMKPQPGFPDGARILITGSPGTGKTTFALAVCRDLMKQVNTAKLIYVSTEIDLAQLTQCYSKFGWFSQQDDVFDLNRGRVVIPEIPDLGVMHRPQGSGSLVELVLRELASAAKDRNVNQRKDPILVVVDSLTAVLKDSRDAGEHRRQAFKLITGLKSIFGSGRQSLFFLTAENELMAADPGGERPSEEYVSDFVFKLDLKELSGGHRRRTMEVTKSRGASMLLGEHTFQIVTADNIDELIGPLRDRVCESVTGRKRIDMKAEDGPWGTLVVSPRPRQYPTGGLPRQNAEPGNFVWSGSPGLDAMIRQNEKYWTGYPEVETEGLMEGTTTLIVGQAGTGKTLMALQFLLAHDSIEDSKFSLYINFENPQEHVLRMFPSKRDPKDPMRKGLLLHYLEKCPFYYRNRTNLDLNLWLSEVKAHIKEHRIQRVAIDGLSDLLPTTGAAEYPRLVESILRSIRAAVWDASLETRHAEESERLKKNDKARGQKATIFLTFESADHPGPVTSDIAGLSVTADNVVILRQLAIGDELRKTAYILKARGGRPDSQVREIIIQQKHSEPFAGLDEDNDRDKDEYIRNHRWFLPLRIDPGLEAYSNLLSNHPEQASVSLHLFAENEAERRFNEKLIERLKSRTGYTIDSYAFSRSEITRTLRDAVEPTSRIPSSDKVLSLDEWWIREYAVPGQTRGSCQKRLPHPLHGLDRFFKSKEVNQEPQALRSANDGPVENQEKAEFIPPDVQRKTSSSISRSDYWLFEVEKGNVVIAPHTTITDDRSLHEVYDTEMLALPNYTDFGVFCRNTALWNKFALTEGEPKASEKDSSKSLVDRCNMVPRVWTSWIDNDFALPDASAALPTVVDRLEHARVEWFKAQKQEQSQHPDEDGNGAFIGFSFDMETPESTVCTFLEFCWSFGARESFLIDDAVEYANKTSEEEKDNFVEGHPATLAVRFLLFLIEKGLMPSRTVHADSPKAILSRQWYSTLSALEDQIRGGKLKKEASQANDSDEQKAKLRAAETAEINIGVHPVPFFPIGMIRKNHSADVVPSNLNQGADFEPLCNAWEDAFERFDRLLSRTLAAAVYRTEPRNKVTPIPCTTIDKIKEIQSDIRGKWHSSGEPKIPHSRAELAAALDDLEKAGERLYDEIETSNLFIPGEPVPRATLSLLKRLNLPEYNCGQYLVAAKSMDIRDLRELWEWHRLRLEMIRRQMVDPVDAPVASECLGMQAQKQHGNNGTPQIRTLTGYACSGSWMVGVLRSTHMPELSWKLMEEMTSLESTLDRTQLGAGMPPRKDFFEFYGEKPVKHGNGMSWNELLMYTGARARRRERTLCDALKVSEIYDLIYRLLMHCFAFAAPVPRQEDSGIQRNPRRGIQRTHKEVVEEAEKAVKTILEFVVDLMRQRWNNAEAVRDREGQEPSAEYTKKSLCLTCPHTEDCLKAFAPRTQQ